MLHAVKCPSAFVLNDRYDRRCLINYEVKGIVCICGKYVLTDLRVNHYSIPFLNLSYFKCKTLITYISFPTFACKVDPIPIKGRNVLTLDGRCPIKSRNFLIESTLM